MAAPGKCYMWPHPIAFVAVEFFKNALLWQGSWAWPRWGEKLLLSGQDVALRDSGVHSGRYLHYSATWRKGCVVSKPHLVLCKRGCEDRPVSTVVGMK